MSENRPYDFLASACLLGERVRYDGVVRPVLDTRLLKSLHLNRVLAVCPEVLGGLSVPRPPCEIEHGFCAADVLAGRAKIVTKAEVDFTSHFGTGAKGALAAARRFGIRAALLKEASPSCGVYEVNDGTFSHTRVSGEGVLTTLLREAGLVIFNEHEIDALYAFLDCQ